MKHNIEDYTILPIKVRRQENKNDPTKQRILIEIGPASEIECITLRDFLLDGIDGLGKRLGGGLFKHEDLPRFFGMPNDPTKMN